MTIAIKGADLWSGISVYHQDNTEGEPGFVFSIRQQALWVSKAEAERLIDYLNS